MSMVNGMPSALRPDWTEAKCSAEASDQKASIAGAASTKGASSGRFESSTRRGFLTSV